MTTRITFALVLLAAAAAAQEGGGTPAEPKTFLRCYDLGAFSERGKLPSDREEPRPEATDLCPVGASAFHHFDAASGWADDGASSAPGVSIFEDLVRGTVEFMDYAVASGGTRIFVTTTEEGHRVAERILSELRRAVEPVEIEVRHMVFSEDALDDAARALLARAEAGTLDLEALSALAAADRHRGLRLGTMQAIPGKWCAYRSVRELRYVPDYDVEIAQGSAIADPIPCVATEGVKAAVRALPTSDGRLLLRVVASAGDLAPGMRRFEMGVGEVQDQLRLRNSDFRAIEQLDFDGGAISAEGVLAPGRIFSVTLASSAGAERRRDLLLFRIRAFPQPSRPGALAILPIGALSAPDPIRLLRSLEDGELAFRIDEEGGPLLGAEELIDRVDPGQLRSSHEATLFGGCLVVHDHEGSVAAISARLAGLEREDLRPLQLGVRFLAVDSGGSSRLVGVLSTPLVARRVVSLGAYRKWDTIGDYDVEVAQEARIADPIHLVVTAGLFAEAVAFPNPGGGWRLQLELSASGAPDGISVIESRVGGVPNLQSIPIRRCASSARLDLAPGDERTLDLGPDPFTPRATARLVARIRLHE